MDTGIHKIHLFHASDLHFHFSTNTKARWWILKSTKQVKCWIRCIYHCTKHQPQKRERGTVESHSVHFNKIKNDWSVPSLAYKYGLQCMVKKSFNWQPYVIPRNIKVLIFTLSSVDINFLCHQSLITLVMSFVLDNHE